MLNTLLIGIIPLLGQQTSRSSRICSSAVVWWPFTTMIFSLPNWRSEAVPPCTSCFSIHSRAIVKTLILSKFIQAPSSLFCNDLEKFFPLCRTRLSSSDATAILFSFRVDSEIPPIIQIRLKIEINCCEHFNVLGLIQKTFSIENQWVSGNCQLTTYRLEELLGTKFRALYQRRKGRDLFDLFYVLTHADVDIDKILLCHEKYISFVAEQPPSYRQFIANMEEKMQNPEFTEDMTMILRPGLAYDPHEAYAIVREKLIERLPGRR